ncbi:MAG: type II secretion system minor pseudopilin GspK [Thiolinea sp.]
MVRQRTAQKNLGVRQHQRGVAMLTALMITAIAVTIVAAIFVQQRYSIRLTSNFQDLEQAYQYADAAEQLAGVWLKRDLQENQYDSLLDFWASDDLPPFDIYAEGGELGEEPIGQVLMRIEDMQGYLNLNNVLVKKTEQNPNGQGQNPNAQNPDPNAQNPNGQNPQQAPNPAAGTGSKDDPELNKPHEAMMEAFARLFQSLGIPPEFRFSVLDWIDPNDQVADPSSAESADYLALDPPYEAANALLTSPAELYRLRMPGVDDAKKQRELLDALIPLVAVLPTPTALNVNTATPASLAAVGLTPDQISMVSSLREVAPITDKNMLSQNIQGLDPKALAVLGVASNYFRLTGQVRLGKSRLYLNSLLFRSPQGEVHVIMRQFSRAPKPKPADTAFAG